MLSQLAKIVDVVHPFMTTFFLKKYFGIYLRPIYTCGNNFRDSARIMNILYSTEKKGGPLGTTAL